MSYELSFHPDALSEWEKLDDSIHELFKKKLAEHLHNPRAPSARLSAHKDRYKIRLRDAGYRLETEAMCSHVWRGSYFSLRKALPLELILPIL